MVIYAHSDGNVLCAWHSVMRLLESGLVDDLDIPADISADQVISTAAEHGDVDLYARNFWGIRVIDTETLPVAPACIHCDQ